MNGQAGEERVAQRLQQPVPGERERTKSKSAQRSVALVVMRVIGRFASEDWFDSTMRIQSSEQEGKRAFLRSRCRATRPRRLGLTSKRTNRKMGVVVVLKRRL